MPVEQEIIDYIRGNRVSTTEVADALGKTGVVPGVAPLTPDQFKVGRVRCIFTAFNSNYALHDQIRHLKRGDVVLVFAHECEGRALLGDLVSRFILLYQNAEALVVAGQVRDAARLRRERYPIWARGATPLGCFNEPAPVFPPALKAQIRRQHERGVAVCDDGGVVVIPPDRLTRDTLDRLHHIELQEDIWYYCLNTLKWDTKRIVCEKAYLKNPAFLPAPLAGQLRRPRNSKSSK